MKEEGIWKRLTPLVGAQFLGIFNDHAFKMVTVLTAVGISRNYSTDTAFLSIMTIAFVAPFILFSESAGYFADKFSKRVTLILSKAAELLIMLLGVYVFSKVPEWGVSPLIGVMFLMAAQSTFFSPPFSGILPELFPEKDLSKVNGIAGMLSFSAIILGVSGGFIIKSISGNELYMCGVIFSFISLAGFLFSLKIFSVPAANKARKWDWSFIAKHIEGFKFMKSKKSLFLAVLGESYFYAVGAFIQSVLIILAKYNLDIPGTSAVDIGILQLAPALGMGAGCFLAGYLSGNKVELGLVPFGAIGMVVFLILTAFVQGPCVDMGLFMFYPVLFIILIFLGMAGGIFVIPLKAYQQQRTEVSERGKFFGNANKICFTAILFSGFLMFFLSSGTHDVVSKTSGILSFLQSYCLSLTPSSILIILALLTFSVSAYLFWLLPEFAIRFIIVILTKIIYKMRITGAENIPEKGPALLVSNHVSFVDGLLITACTSRSIRFLMHEDYYRYPLLYPFVKWAGFIEVPSMKRVGKMNALFETTKKYLRNGEILCVFPEGKLTRNGVMDEFKEGIRKMLPEEIRVPIIPIRLGMIWGSIFSYYYGKIKFRFPMEFPHPASVTIGPPVADGTTPFEMRQIISELAAETELVPRSEERPIHYQFAKLAKQRPFRKTIYDFGKNKACGNFELLVRAILLSRKIRELSAPEDKYVGVLLPNTSAAALTLLAVMMADKVPAVLNFTSSKASIETAIAKADIKCILSSRLFLEKAGIEKIDGMVFLEDIAKSISKMKKYAAFLTAAFLPRQELMKIVAPESHRDVFRTAVLLFSSGSTGLPKGIMLSHHNISSNVYSFLRIMGWSHKDSIMGSLPLFHSFGLITGFWIPMMTGCKVVYTTNPLDATSIGRALEEHKLTILLATPTFIQAYMRKCAPKQFLSLRLVVTGAEKLRSDIAEKFRKMTGLSLIEGYGCTELSPVVSINVSNSILNIGIIPGKQGSIGPPMPGICVKIVDPATFKVLPPDTDGLMLVKGANVMLGYLNEPEKTAEIIKDGWYNTGDIAKMNGNGYLTITGRISRFSKIGGEMVPHELVENTINEILKTEERCIAVTGIPDKTKGEKLIVFHTYLELIPEKIIEEMRIKGLPNLWIPRADAFIKLEHMPLLGSGKLDLSNIRQLAEKVAADESE
ncbi:MAG: hypothetical protein A2017_21230 [Lentisphaerae bacterium GWF2_44_16]|nr:MAG: hypothetical protein A2017_21230 [Lentisphaerae bacterium GWF2_44_16]